MSLLIDCVRAYGTVAWTDDDLCGVAFDAPLARFEFGRLQRGARNATLSFGSVETKIAVHERMGGMTP